MLTRLSVSPTSEDHYSLRNGLIRYRDRIWIPDTAGLKGKILAALHDSPIGRHSGIPVTLRRIKQSFYWKRLRASVQQYVQECSICQRAKPDHARYPGLLEPLPVPSQYWQMLTMDFVEGLLRSGHFNCVMVVVDKLSRYAHFIGLSHPFTASVVAAAFMDHVHKLHGMPESIVSDRDRIFTSRF